MTASALPEDQLLELLTQLQKTTPDQARSILNAQPQIGYALVPLMARMGVVSLEVLQKTLSTYAAPASSSSTPAPSSTIVAPAPTSTPVPVPPHLTYQTQAQAQAPYTHHPTPPPATHTPVHGALPSSLSAPAPAPASTTSTPVPAGVYAVQNGGAYGGTVQGYGQYGQQGWNGQPQQQAQTQAAAATAGGQGAPAGAAAMLGALGNIPDDQREMIMRVISMTPDQIARLPPQDRAITIQLRATLGLPTE